MKKGFIKIAERRLISKNTMTGKCQDVVIKVGKPYWIERDIQAACPIIIHGILKKIEIYGGDLLSSLECALKVIDSTLEKSPHNCELFWDGEEKYESTLKSFWHLTSKSE